MCIVYEAIHNSPHIYIHRSLDLLSAGSSPEWYWLLFTIISMALYADKLATVGSEQVNHLSTICQYKLAKTVTHKWSRLQICDRVREC